MNFITHKINPASADEAARHSPRVCADIAISRHFGLDGLTKAVMVWLSLSEGGSAASEELDAIDSNHAREAARSAGIRTLSGCRDKIRDMMVEKESGFIDRMASDVGKVRPARPSTNQKKLTLAKRPKIARAPGKAQSAPALGSSTAAKAMPPDFLSAEFRKLPQVERAKLMRANRAAVKHAVRRTIFGN